MKKELLIAILLCIKWTISAEKNPNFKQPTNSTLLTNTSAPTVPYIATNAPTTYVTNVPTPSINGTIENTDDIDINATAVPSYYPTSFPSAMPSESPTSPPSHLASEEPSLSQAPTPYPTTTHQPTLTLNTAPVSDILMRFDNLVMLSSIDVWKNVTIQRIEDYLDSIETLIDFRVELPNGSVQQTQILLNVLERLLQQQSSSNNSSSNKKPLEIEFDVIVYYRSTVPDFDMNGAVGDAFITWSFRNIYMNMLKDADPDTFDSISTLVVNVPDPPKTSPVVEKEGFLENTTVIVALAAGSAAVIFLIATWFYYRTNKDEKEAIVGVSAFEDINPQGNKAQMPPFMNFHQGSIPFGEQEDRDNISPVKGRYIDTADNEDVSTLGYPTVVGKPEGTPQKNKHSSDVSTLGEPTLLGITPTYRQQTDAMTTASESIIKGGFTMSRIYGDAATLGNSTMNTGTKLLDSIDPTKDAIIHIDAPSGTLGIMLDMSRESGPHVIHAVRDDSVLAGRIRVGDLIVQFDNEDVGGLTAMELTQIIGKRGMNPTRTFKVVRHSPLGSRIDNLPDMT